MCFSAAASITALFHNHNTLVLHAHPHPHLSLVSFNLYFLAFLFTIVPRRWNRRERFGPRRSLCLGSCQQPSALLSPTRSPTVIRLDLVRPCWASSPDLEFIGEGLHLSCEAVTASVLPFLIS
ncbi:hypothetical protein BDV06DRAFT_81315 [Aspergillus oleicola]